MASIRHGSLTLPLPTDWVDASQVVALGPLEGTFRTSLVVSLEPIQPDETAQQFAARRLPEVRKVAPEFSLVAEKQATFGGKEGWLREQTFLVEGVRIAQLQFHVVKDGTGFTFTYTQRADRLKRSRDVAEAFFASAQLGAKAEPARPTGIRG